MVISTWKHIRFDVIEEFCYNVPRSSSVRHQTVLHHFVQASCAPNREFYSTMGSSGVNVSDVHLGAGSRGQGIA